MVNNAGYGHFGMVEELSEADVRDQLETNLFGALWVTQAALPFLREQGSGHIIQVSSIGGISAFPNVGAYHASKWALEGFSQALAQEVSRSASTSRWSSRAASPPTGRARRPRPRPRTRRLRQGAGGRPSSGPSRVPPGVPRRPGAILRIVDAETPPLRMFLGEAPLGIATADYASRLATWREWQPVSVAAQG